MFGGFLEGPYKIDNGCVKMCHTIISYFRVEAKLTQLTVSDLNRIFTRLTIERILDNLNITLSKLHLNASLYNPLMVDQSDFKEYFTLCKPASREFFYLP